MSSFREMSILVVVALCGAMAHGQGVVFVDAANQSGSADGLTWATAFPTLQAGIDAAEAGGEVWVADGSYGEDRTAADGAVLLRESISVYGGFAGGETALDERDASVNIAVIDGATSNDGSPAVNVVRAASDAVLDGFTVRGGRGDSGAGLLVDGVSVRIANCRFVNNATLGFGGAVAVVNGANAEFRDCVFEQNSSDTDGGAIAALASTLQTFNCRFLENSAGGDGGAVFNGANATATLDGDEYLGNFAEDQGGGIYNAGSSNVRLLRAQVLRNQVNNRGAGVSNAPESTVLIAGCLFARNDAVIHGGGINNTNVSPTIVSTTVTQNSATFRGAGIYNNGDQIAVNPIVSGLIVWDNIGENVGNNGVARLFANFSNIEGGIGGGTGNIALPPRFVSPDTDDFRLRAGSPCIDTGQDTSSAALGRLQTDFEGDARGFDGDGQGQVTGVGDASDYDMGFDEFTGPLEPEGEPEGILEGEGAEEGSPEEGEIEGTIEGLQEGEGAQEGEGVEEGAVEGEPAEGEGEGATEGSVEGEQEGAAEGEVEGQAEGELEFDGVVYVNKNNTTGNRDGRSWATALTDIHTALQVAFFEDIPEIWVAGGVYNEERPGNGTLFMRSGISLYGGFAGTETQRSQRDFRANPTVIDGSRADEGRPVANVIQGADAARLDGFTVRGGRGFAGAALLNFATSPVIANCLFTDNDATDFGGAVFNLDGASPLFTNCTFDSNTAGESGGAMVSLDSAASVINCTFINNRSGFGGAAFNNVSGGEFVACTFAFNEATESAGALAILDSSPAIIGCVFSGNLSSATAGALFINVGSARVEDCRFFDNVSNGSGGAIFTLGPPTEPEGITAPFILNSIFAGNSAAQLGGAIFNNTARPRIVNCTIYGNTAGDTGGGIGNFQSSTSVTNSILWDNSEAVTDLLGASDVSFSIVQGGFNGTGNLGDDPQFVNPGLRNFRLLATSPAIDAGRGASSSAFGNVIDDIEGRPRGLDGTPEVRGDGSDYDIGAFEFGDPVVVEGEPEGSIEGEGCLLGEVDVLSPGNGSVILVGNSLSPLPVGLSARTDCATDTSFVRYLLDGELVGGRDDTPYAVTIPDITRYPAGRHVVVAQAYDAAGNTPPLESSPATFTLLGAPAAADANGNGLPEQATTVLLQDGDIWSSKVEDPQTGAERVTRVNRFDRTPGNADTPVVSVLGHPDLPGVLVSIELDRRILANDGDIGLLVVAISTNLDALLGRDESVQISAQPEGGITTGALYTAAGVLVSSDNGATFTRLAPEQLDAFPAKVSIEGVTFPVDNTGLWGHPLNVRSGGSGGLRIDAVFDGGWSTGAVKNLSVEPQRLRALLGALDLFAPFNQRPLAATLQVTPAQQGFGRVEVGQSAQRSFVVTNRGGGILSGRAQVDAPFRIASGARYTLAPGESQDVVVLFVPDAAQDYAAQISFSGGSGATRVLTGTGVLPSKANAWLGCHPGDGTRFNGMADVLLCGAVVLALFAARRRMA